MICLKLRLRKEFVNYGPSLGDCCSITDIKCRFIRILRGDEEFTQWFLEINSLQ